MRETRRIFLAFFIFGLLNNILYVVILSAAIDLVGRSTPKAVVLLADIIPSLTVKILAPFFIHLLLYQVRVWFLVALSTTGMVIISLTRQEAKVYKVFGIAMASLSSGMGEVSFLQLTHYYQEMQAVGGFSSGTGGAGLLGSFLFMLLTNVMGIQTWIALLLFAIAPLGFVTTFYFLLPSPSLDYIYQTLPEHEIQEDSNSIERVQIPVSDNEFYANTGDSKHVIDFSLLNHVQNTLRKIHPLIWPYMLPLCTVYVAEYVINQGISPTLLFPLDEVPSWLIKSHRDTYVVYGFLYQLGVFISRSSVSFGVRVRQLYVLSILQTINVGITLIQSLYDAPFNSIFLLLGLIFYEGLLGGLLYVNTFMSVSEEVPKDRREFSMGCVGISDSFGVMLAGCINWWLETKLCDVQTSHGRDWCRAGE